MGRIAETGYRGCIPIEAEMHTAGYSDLPDFLRRTAETGRRLETMLKEATP